MACHYVPRGVELTPLVVGGEYCSRYSGMSWYFYRLVRHNEVTGACTLRPYMTKGPSHDIILPEGVVMSTYKFRPGGYR